MQQLQVAAIVRAYRFRHDRKMAGLALHDPQSHGPDFVPSLITALAETLSDAHGGCNRPPHITRLRVTDGDIVWVIHNNGTGWTVGKQARSSFAPTAAAKTARASTVPEVR